MPAGLRSHSRFDTDQIIQNRWLGLAARFGILALLLLASADDLGLLLAVSIALVGAVAFYRLHD